MRTMHRVQHEPAAPPDARDLLARAWLLVASTPLFAIAAFALGEAVISWLGYPVGGSNPWWVTLLSDAAAVTVSLAPCALGAWYAQRSRLAGERAALVPLFVAVVLGAALLGLTVVSIAGDLLR